MPGTLLWLVRLLLHALLVAHAYGTTTAAAAAAGLPPADACPCSRPSLCQPVTATHQREVFGFSVSQDTPYERYDWSQLTTVAWNEDPALMCAAHAAGARVVLDGRGADARGVYVNRTARAAWLAERVQHALRHHLDGINFDLEDPLPPGDPLAGEYAALVAEAAAAFHATIPGSQVSVDVPWSPYGIDGRYYDWSGLAGAADLLFVMMYDTQSQMWGRCVAAANSPLALARRGVQQWLDLGVPANKLVLGLPWYGYVYPCTNHAFAAGQEQELCQLAPVGFAGAPCSDAAGRQTCYSDIAAMVRRGSSEGSNGSRASSGSSNGGGGSRGLLIGQRGGAGGLERQEAEQGQQQQQQEEVLACEQPRWDDAQAAPYARCRRASDPLTHSHQVWFDDPASLERKCALAAELGLRGVGMWHLDCLDYRCTDSTCRQGTEAMWAALRAFTGGAQVQIDDVA